MNFKLLIILIILIISVIIFIIYSSNNKTTKNEKNEISRRKEADDIANIMTKIINQKGIKENFDKYYNNDYQIDHLKSNEEFKNIKKLMKEKLKGIKFCGNIINDNDLKIKIKYKDTGVYIAVTTSLQNTEGCRSLDNDNEIFHLSIHLGKRPNKLSQSEIHLKFNGFDNDTESWDLYEERDNYKFKYNKIKN